MDSDGLLKMLTLMVLGELLVFDPFQAVAGDFPARLVHRRHRIRGARECSRNSVHRQWNATAGEQAPNAPETDARSIFEQRLHVHVAHALPRLRAKDFGEESLGCG